MLCKQKSLGFKAVDFEFRVRFRFFGFRICGFKVRAYQLSCISTRWHPSEFP